MRAKGYRLVHGLFTDEPPSRRSMNDPPPPHGTPRRYRQGCKCAECRLGIAEYNAERRRLRRMGLL
jgi:hypothetical protein